MPTITIEFELGDGYEQDPETGEFFPVDRESFDEQIITRVVEKFASTLNYEGRRKLDEAVTTKADALIAERLTAEIDKVLASPLNRYDYSGKPKGDPFTINELVVKAVEEFAAAPAGPTDSYGRPKGPQNLASLVQQIVAEALEKELAKTVQETRQLVADQIADRLSKSVAAAVVSPRR